MDLMPSEDQEAIQQTVRSFLADHLPLEKTRESAKVDLADVWKEAGSLGFFGLGLREAQGGSGFTLTEEMVLFTELGRILGPGPWLGSVLAAHAVEDASLRRRILDGSLSCGFVTPRAGDTFEVEGATARGKLSQVADAATSGALIVESDDGWYFVERSTSWQVEPSRSLDPTRPVAALSFEASCRSLAQASAELSKIATVLACSEAVGGIERTVEMSVEYCKVREQFGKPIGSFQAVKHRCADMAVRAEVARSATIYAAIAVRDGLHDAEHHVAVAKLLCGDAYLQNAADNIQNHGGMGFTWECDAHFYMKRAHSFDAGLGARAVQLDKLVAEMRA